MKKRKFIKHKNKFSSSENKQRMIFISGLLFLVLIIAFFFIIIEPVIASFFTIILLVILFIIFSPQLLYRRLRWNIANIKHFKKFPHKIIKNISPAFCFGRNIKEGLVVSLLKHRHDIKNLDEFFKVTDTTAFVVISDDTVIYEKYFNGYNRESTQVTYSITK